MDRRKFLQGGLMAGALFLLPPVSQTASGTTSVRRKKPGPKPGFRLGYIGRAGDYLEFSGKLKGLVSVMPEKTNLREVRKEGIRAVIVSERARRTTHTINSLLEQQVAVLWQIPAGISQSGIDAICTGQFPGEPFLLPFEPLYFERHVLQLKDYLAAENLGKIQSIRLQYNQPGSQGEEEDITQLVRMICLLHQLTGSWPDSIEVQRPGEKLRAQHPHAFFFSLNSAVYKAQGTTLPDYFGKENGWSIRIIGHKGQATLLAYGTLELFDPSEGKSWPVKAQQYDPLLGTRLQIEDFISRAQGLKPGVNGMEEIRYRKRINEALKKSLEDGREVNLSESRK
jgi:hypothetical protein